MSKIDEAIDILKQMGVPKSQQNERSGLTLLALLDLKEQTPWATARQQLLRIHDILVFVNTHYGKDYAENTRETIRRQTIHQFEQAGLEKGRLAERYKKLRDRHHIVVYAADTSLTFSPGKHNELQARVIDTLRSRFFPAAQLVYVGDAANKMLYVEEELLDKLNIPFTEHDKLPDVVFYDENRKILFLVEAVTSHGPVSPKRQIELEQTLRNCEARKAYISAFPTLVEFKRHIDDIAWETEVWIAATPGHMIHFNGPKFLYVHTGEEF